MTRIGLALIILPLLTLALGACTGSASEPVDNDATSTVPGFDIDFDHPTDLVLQGESGDMVQYCFESEQDTRFPRCLRFSRSGDLPDDGDRQALELASGGDFSYVTQSVDGGSGGVEHSLDGQVELGSDVIFVSATANEEAGFNDAGWALPLIESIRR